ncbi:hypothetical protein [Agrococcus lahaulensis]|uniref:hypothetical protein n=1 Tax=Agrococcus lahaulensis TaxID=341722 RepID=UPI00047C7F3F|nr:hypothetical protein [Agrococcus lahaulensis]
MTDLRTLLRGGDDTVPAFRMLLPQGWVSYSPDEQSQEELLAAAAKRLATAGRPDLLVQLRRHAATAFSQLREQRAILVMMPGEEAPQSLFLPATITAVERVSTPDAPVREVVVDAIRRKGAKPLDDRGVIVRWLERRDVELDGESSATTSIVYVIAVPGTGRRRALQLTAVITHPTDLPADDDVLEQWIALIDAHVATFAWEP